MNDPSDGASGGLICAYRLDGEPAAAITDWDAVRAAWAGEGTVWIHLDHAGAVSRRWHHEESGLDPLVVSALVAEETRPRAEPIGDGLLLNLRAVNLNPGADPDDMVSIRIYADARRVVSVRLRRLMAIVDMRSAIEAGTGPQTTEAFLQQLVAKLTDRMWPVIEALEGRLDDVEELVVEIRKFETRSVLAVIRQQAIGLRRYIAPQREALTRIVGIEAGWIGDRVRRQFRESADRVTRIVEDLDTIRERAAVVQDELSNRLSEEMNRRMYALSVIAGIFLPLSLLTGLLGINVAGIPGAEEPSAFLIVCGLLVVIAILEIFIFRKMRWF
ncbi:MAG: zinc transporter ZntB [Candidatus Eisenbacteria bacterium]|nr:zinc transporter ZntB [Candidatus Latescibacterota bacterium]MBD3303041.1 zinc transporter ZntB [Candidatus Eisenbacteria bacterium]